MCDYSRHCVHDESYRAFIMLPLHHLSMGLSLAPKVALDKLKHTITSLMGFIRRISRGNNSMTEHNTLRLVQALVLSRLTYALPYQTTWKTKQEQAHILIRLVTKVALGLPTRTSTQHLLELVVHNTFKELAASTLISQRERLCSTPQRKFLFQGLRSYLTVLLF